MKLEKDEIISHYKILSEIGKGGMGEVYLAQDTMLDRNVAIKLLTHECCDNDDRVQRFSQEAKTASALNHPNIITIFEFGKYEKSHYIVSEFIDGNELGMMKSDQLSLGTILDISVQVVSALKIAHEAGIIHRDIKPGNIMVRKDGIVKILDFGLAKLTSIKDLGVKGQIGEDETLIATVENQRSTNRDTNLTLPGMIMGTPNYMSPEQARGKVLDHQTDIFSFGIVLYELLTNKRPFTGETISDIIAAILTKAPEPLRSVNIDLPPELETIIEKALGKSKNERYLTSAELLEDLNQLKQMVQIRELVDDDTATKIFKSAEITKPDSAIIESKSSIAVLPFFDMNAGDESDYFCEGLTDEIIMNLSKLKKLKVVARGSSMLYENEGKTHRQTAEDLGVQYLLEGSVRRSGANLRITAQLIDTANQTYLWSETYRGTIEDVFEIQEKVATEIVMALEVKLSPDEQQDLRKRYTENTEAYQLYLQGRFFWNKRNEEALKTAIRYFEMAIEKDPDYALAWAGIADSYGLIGEYGTIPRKLLYPKAEAAVNRALELDDRLAEVHTSLASLLMLNKWDWENAQKEFKIALELNPNYATAYHWYSQWFVTVGNLEKALEFASRAAELDPVSQAIVKDKGIVFYYSRRYDEAIEQALRTLELDPDYSAGHRLLSLAYQGKEMFYEAIESNERWGKITGNNVEKEIWLAQIYGVSGKHEQALAIANELEKLNPMPPNGYRGLASIYAAVGMIDESFEKLQKSFELKEESLISLKVDPKLDALRDDPRFNELLKKLNLND